MFHLPSASKSNEVCAMPSLVGWERCASPILLAACGFSCEMFSAFGFSAPCLFQLPVNPMKFVLCRNELDWSFVLCRSSLPLLDFHSFRESLSASACHEDLSISTQRGSAIALVMHLGPDWMHGLWQLPATQLSSRACLSLSALPQINSLSSSHFLG